MRIVAPLLLNLSLAAMVFAQPWPRHVIDDSSRGADGVRLADVNGDRRPDIVTGWEEGGLIRLYQHPGASSVTSRWPAVTVGRVRSPEDAVFADLDGDGFTDVVSSCEGKDRSIYFHWSPADEAQRLAADAWSTVAVPAAQGRQMWMYAVPVQLDGQRGMDLVVGSKGANASISWLQSPQNPRQVDQWHLHLLRPSGWIMSLVMHDMDGDDDPDILFSDRKTSTRGVAWLENPGAAATRAKSVWQEHAIGGSDHEVMFLALGDCDGNGTLDIAAATRDGPLLVFSRPHGQKPWTRVEVPLPPGCGTGKGVAIGNVDRRGLADLVFTCENARGDLSGVRWLSRSAGLLDAATWYDHEIGGPAGWKFDRIELLDLDEDGDLDVLTCEERDNLGVVWYQNPTLGR